MQTLDRHFQLLTRACFERYGFAYAELLRQWPAIAGEDLAAVSRPQRIRWPAGRARDKRNGTLVVAAMAGRTLDVHYAAPRLIERINGYYGYAAITGVKVVTGELEPAERQPAPERAAPAPPPDIDGIADEPLEQALLRLAAGIAKDRSSGKREG